MVVVREGSAAVMGGCAVRMGPDANNIVLANLPRRDDATLDQLMSSGRECSRLPGASWFPMFFCSSLFCFVRVGSLGIG